MLAACILFHAVPIVSLCHPNIYVALDVQSHRTNHQETTSRRRSPSFLRMGDLPNEQEELRTSTETPREVSSSTARQPREVSSRASSRRRESSFGKRRSSSSFSSSRQRRRAASPSPEKKATTIKRAPHQFDHTKEEARPFVDTLSAISSQVSNEDAPVFSLDEGTVENESRTIIQHPHIETHSLDDLFPGLQLSKHFFESTEFRNRIRDAIREDVFRTTEVYAGLSDKARKMLLQPDSSLQGSWKCSGGRWVGAESGGERMLALTTVLRDELGAAAPTGDEFMDAIGGLCGSSPQTHWIDIVGVLDRKIPHSWHLDTGRSPGGDTKTVCLGFPAIDCYEGVGVFSHFVKLEKEQWADENHPPNQPVLYQCAIDEQYIVRPRFAAGREIIVYRDVDVLHSAPDVAYRSSVMRFM